MASKSQPIKTKDFRKSAGSWKFRKDPRSFRWSLFSASKNTEAAPWRETRTVDLPEGSRDTILPGNVGGLEEGGGPSPLRDDDGSSKPRLDHATRRAEMRVRRCQISEREVQCWGLHTLPGR